MLFVEGVDEYVIYAGEPGHYLGEDQSHDGLLRGDECRRLPYAGARLTFVSEQSFQESHANVTIRETSGTTH